MNNTPDNKQDFKGARSPWPIMLGTLVIVVAASVIVLGKDVEKSLVAHVKLPALSQQAIAGREVVNTVCAECHGVDGTGGTAFGPTLFHPIYRPSTHADLAIRNAVTQGVRAHHFKYGDMPAQTQVTGAQLDALIAFIREVQAENKLF